MTSIGPTTADNSNIDGLIIRLQQLLQADVNHLMPAPANAVARQAAARLHATATYSPAFIAMLAEPWLNRPISADIQQLVTDCARIHLYARILDDALDENLPVHRQNLLSAQPMMWDAIHSLARYAPGLGRESVALVAETIQAVRHDDNHPDPRTWGSKNHHLLLVPMLLSSNGEAFQLCRDGLSALISLVQAGDEWRQGVLTSAPSNPITDALLEQIPTFLHPDRLDLLQSHGWHAAAERILLEGKKILCAIESRKIP